MLRPSGILTRPTELVLAGCKRVCFNFNADAVQHADVQVGQRRVAVSVVCDVAAVLKAATGEDDWQASGVVVGQGVR